MVVAEPAEIVNLVPLPVGQARPVGTIHLAGRKQARQQVLGILVVQKFLTSLGWG